MNQQFFEGTSFFPCYYKRGQKTDSFFLLLNFNALRTLVENNLVMKIPSHNCEVKFELHLKCAEWIQGQIYWPNKLNYVVNKRINDSKLNLDNFANDSDLTHLSVTMTSTNCMNIILQTAQRINNKIIAVSLQGNQISSAESLKIFSNFPNLVSLDLTNNNIQSFESFPKMPRVVELFLDKNPVCVNYYEKPWKFVKDLREILPKLQHIDHRKIDANSTTVFMRNFLVSQNSYTMTERFVNFFFELYDSCIRKSMKKLYDDTSMFTMCSKENSRNLLYDEDFMENVFVGVENITDFFETLPRTTHDFTTMCVDVPLMTEKNVLITVNGFFKVLADSLNGDDVIQGFTRTFFLEQQEKKIGALPNTFKYRIKNEQLTVHEVSAEVAKIVFAKNVVTETEMNKICQDLLPVKSQEEEAKLLLLQDLTQLKENWCTRLLEDANWNIKQAVSDFNDFIDRDILCLEDFDLKYEAD